MGSKLELIGINERNGLVTPNLYKQNWLIPSNTTNNYGVLHTRALSDTTTPIYGKGTGKFLDTANGGGDYDINGSINYAGSGRLNAISINTAQWSYGPATPYSVINTRALSDTITPVYGKGTGLFLDPDNGGGSYDINGDQIKFPDSGRLKAISINTAQWSYGPATPYSVINTRALSDTGSTVYGKGTGLFLDPDNGGGSYDINGDQIKFPGSGREASMKNNLATWGFGKPYTENYTVLHSHALSPTITPKASDLLTSEGLIGNDVHGKGTKDTIDLNNINDFILPAHTNYIGGSWDDIISRERIIRNPYNLYWVDTKSPSNKNNWYTVLHQNALANSGVKGKGTGDGIGSDGTYAAHTNYAGGSSVDISGNTLYNGSGRNASNTSNTNSTIPTITITKGFLSIGGSSKPFGYGFATGKDYITTKPACSDATDTTNVGKIKW
jgi:hypothetical protein